MVYTQHLCARCNSEQIRCNSTQGGQPKYQCKACGYQARFVPAAVAKAAQYAQAEALLTERNSQRSIVRATGLRCTPAGSLCAAGGRPKSPPGNLPLAAWQSTSLRSRLWLYAAYVMSEGAYCRAAKCSNCRWSFSSTGP